MATVDKCNGVINPDGSDMPRNPNLMEVSKNYKINDSLSNICHEINQTMSNQKLYCSKLKESNQL